MSGAEACVELPRYKCHKEVWALKIRAIDFAEDGSAKIAPTDKGCGVLETLPGFRARFKGGESDLGYFVQYVGGYQSWSPSKEFEDGYTKVSP